MFQLRKPPKGWPKNLSDVDFRSSLLVDNISHVVTPVTTPEPMDTSGLVEGEMQAGGERVAPTTLKARGT